MTAAEPNAHGKLTARMESPDFARFRQSMDIGYEQWHDGIGYDLEALARLADDERQLAFDILVARRSADWRDIEALDCLGSPEAIKQVEGALKSKDITVRIEAAQRLAQRELLSDERIESLIIDALDSTTLLNGMVKTLDFAEAHPTTNVRHKLLSCARHGNDDIRVHAAALAHFLYGGSSTGFDWSFRPLYLRFGSEDESERQAALVELCRSVDVNPEFAA